MKMLFSQRKGLKPVKSIMQKDSIDEDTRIRLWNLLDNNYWSIIPKHNGFLRQYDNLYTLLKIIWHNFFKLPLDTLEDWFPDSYIKIRKHFFDCEWHEVYSFVEFVANNFLDVDNPRNQKFVELCNSVLEEELSAYRFVGGIIIPITSEEEIKEIEHALENTDFLNGVNTHLKTALERLSDRKNPDYRNSIKESISSVEAISKLITNDEKTTLGKALEKIEKKIALHSDLKEAFKKLYGYTSDAEGIRHALMDESKLDFEDAKFMLVSCSAFVNYLIAKSEKAGIKLNEK